jgi:hypothetical protein
MTPRLYLRSGEVPVLYGLDSAKSEWALWNELRKGQDTGAGDYGRWQGRLMVPIMQGIAEDHGLKIETHVDPHSTRSEAIMPPRCWRIAPSMTSRGRPAIMVVSQRTESSLREWKEPGTMPNRSAMRYRAIAAAHDVEDILVGILVDGYSSRLFHLSVEADERKEIRRRAEEFIEKVRNDDEPDLDFSADAVSIRAGKAVAKVQAAAESVDALLDEHARIVSDRAPVDASLKRMAERLRQIDTALIHMAGPDGRLEVGDRIVVVERNAKNVPTVKVISKAPSSLF